MKMRYQLIPAKAATSAAMNHCQYSDSPAMRMASRTMTDMLAEMIGAVTPA